METQGLVRNVPKVSTLKEKGGWGWGVRTRIRGMVGSWPEIVLSFSALTGIHRGQDLIGQSRQDLIGENVTSFAAVYCCYY